MRRLLLLLVILWAAMVAARAQPSSSFPMRKACRDILPQILYVLNAQQVTSTGRTYVFHSKSEGNDTLRLDTDSLPMSISIHGLRFSMKFGLYADRILALSHANPAGWTVLNPNGFQRHDMPLDNLDEPTLDRFMLEAVATGYMYQTGNSEARRVEKPPGSVRAVSYFYTPTRGMAYIMQAEKEGQTFCSSDDNSLTSAAVEIVPFGSIFICYKKRGR